jgi:hypothetical protein
MQTLETVLGEYFNALKNNTRSLPLFLGGISTSGGGSGGPPGGFVGKLPQTKITYDMSEEATDYTPLSGYTLLDNLNHIRYRLGIIESGGVEGNINLVIMQDDSEVASGVTVINFEGDITVTPIPSGVTVTMVATSGLTDAPIDGEPYGRKDGAWVVISGGTGTTDHTELSNIGVNTHDQIDTALTRLATTSGNNSGDQFVPIKTSDLINDSGFTTVSGIEEETDPIWASEKADYLTKIEASGLYEPNKGIDDNYVTNAEKINLSNLSGVNSGDVTVVDTSTIDLSLVGQELSANIIVSGIDHTTILNIGTNSHDDIDTALTRLILTSGNNSGDQDLSGLVEEAPIDSLLYGRKDGEWNEITVSGGSGITPAYGVADVFGFGNAGSSGWTGTINGAPSGAVITYTHVSGNKTSLKPLLATLLARQRLHNITRGEYGLILTSNDTSTITLTENVPVTWQSGDTITTNSPTVNLAGYVDIEFIDGVGVGVNGLFLLLNLKDTAAVGATVVIHPYAAYNTRKAIVLYTQVVNIFFNAVAPVAIISDCFVLKWEAGGVNTETVTIRFVAKF